MHVRRHNRIYIAAEKPGSTTQHTILTNAEQYDYLDPVKVTTPVSSRMNAESL